MTSPSHIEPENNKAVHRIWYKRQKWIILC